jgi:membrane associated rhomboid family serine protease
MTPMPKPRVCMSCESVREGARCEVCGDTLLHLSDETDRYIVRTAIQRPSALEMVAFLSTCAIAVIGVLLLDGAARVAAEGLITVGAFVSLAVVMVLVRMSRRRAWGLASSDLEGELERAERKSDVLEMITGVPLWAVVICLAIHAARALSPAIEAALAPFALRLDDVREGNIGPSVIAHALLHRDVVHVLFNCAALILFGSPLEMRVRRAGVLLLLLAGIVAGAFAQPLLMAGGTTMVGISGGVYAWIAAPAVLDPNMRSVFTVRGVAIPVPMWLRVALMMLLYTGIDALVGRGSIAIFAHLGGACAGLLVAILLRWVKPRPSYARWRAEHQARADRV